MLLTLMKLRLELLHEDLAARFMISVSTVSSVFSTWVKILASVLKPSIQMPAPEFIRANLPKCSSKYKNVRYIGLHKNFYRETQEACSPSAYMVGLQKAQYHQGVGSDHTKRENWLPVKGLGRACLRQAHCAEQQLFRYCRAIWSVHGRQRFPYCRWFTSEAGTASATTWCQREGTNDSSWCCKDNSGGKSANLCREGYWKSKTLPHPEGNSPNYSLIAGRWYHSGMWWVMQFAWSICKLTYFYM